jgi:hypothetical protein
MNVLKSMGDVLWKVTWKSGGEIDVKYYGASINRRQAVYVEFDAGDMTDSKSVVSVL